MDKWTSAPSSPNFSSPDPKGPLWHPSLLSLRVTWINLHQTAPQTTSPQLWPPPPQRMRRNSIMLPLVSTIRSHTTSVPPSILRSRSENDNPNPTPISWLEPRKGISGKKCASGTNSWTVNSPQSQSVSINGNMKFLQVAEYSWVQIQAQLLTEGVTSGKSLYLSVPQYPPL